MCTDSRQMNCLISAFYIDIIQCNSLLVNVMNELIEEDIVVHEGFVSMVENANIALRSVHPHAEDMLINLNHYLGITWHCLHEGSCCLYICHLIVTS